MSLILLLHQQIIRKDYPGIVDWPGRVEKPDLPYSAVPEKFYPSFSSFWKQVEKVQLLSKQRI